MVAPATVLAPMVGVTDTVFRRLCSAMGQPELATDGRFVDHGARGRNQDELDKIIGDWAAERQPDDIIESLSAAGGPAPTYIDMLRYDTLQIVEALK